MKLFPQFPCPEAAKKTQLLQYNNHRIPPLWPTTRCHRASVGPNTFTPGAQTLPPQAASWLGNLSPAHSTRPRRRA